MDLTLNDNMWLFLHSKLLSLIDKYVSTQTFEPNSKTRPKWLDPSAFKQKHKAWNTYKATVTIFLYIANRLINYVHQFVKRVTCTSIQLERLFNIESCPFILRLDCTSLYNHESSHNDDIIHHSPFSFDIHRTI